jgi:hypothetical protein
VPDSSAIDAGLLAHLRADAALAALLPDGVHMDVATAGARRFVLVSLIIATDTGEFSRRAFEEATYLVKVVMFGAANGEIPAAAARLDALLEDGRFPIEGYELMSCVRIERVRGTEVDDADPSIRWYHRGGRYRVQAAPLPETARAGADS